MLFHLCWPSRVSLLVDAADETTARAIGASIADGEAPAKCRPFVGVFAAEVFVVEGEHEDEDDAIVVEPVGYVGEALMLLEDEDDDQDDDAPPLPPSSGVRLDTCGHELEDHDGSILVCSRERHDDDRHEAIDASGERVEWRG